MLIARRRMLQVAGLGGLAISLGSARGFCDGAAGDKQRGEEIALAAEKANSGYVSERVRFTLMLVNAHAEQTERRLSLEVLESGDEDLSRITFDWPAAVRGTTLLTHSKKSGEDEQWFYLPATKAVRRISAGHRTGSFMGSEFSYEDLSSPVVSKYEHALLRTEDAAGRSCYVLVRRPKNEASGYSRELVWLDKERSVPLKVEFYDRKDELLKVATYEGYAAYGKQYRPKLIRMENRQTKKVSVLTATARSLGDKLDPALFQSQALGS